MTVHYHHHLPKHLGSASGVVVPNSSERENDGSLPPPLPKHLGSASGVVVPNSSERENDAPLPLPPKEKVGASGVVVPNSSEGANNAPLPLPPKEKVGASGVVGLNSSERENDAPLPLPPKEKVGASGVVVPNSSEGANDAPLPLPPKEKVGASGVVGLNSSERKNDAPLPLPPKEKVGASGVVVPNSSEGANDAPLPLPPKEKVGASGVVGLNSSERENDAPLPLPPKEKVGASGVVVPNSSEGANDAPLPLPPKEKVGASGVVGLNSSERENDAPLPPPPESEEKIKKETQIVDIVTEPETEEVKQDDTITKEQISGKIALGDKFNSEFHKYVHNLFNNRLAPVDAAGDEETTINRGVWVSGLYGVSSQGVWKNIPKYQGRTAGVTIGADAEFNDSSDIIGVAYSRVESHFKYNKKLGKTALNGHIFSIYALKELSKNFSLQAIASYGNNYVKNKIIDASNIVRKYKNNNFNFEGLLSYKHLTKHNIYLVPNIGLKYDYSRNGNYKESDNIRNLIMQKKSNQILIGSIGSKIMLKPIKLWNNIMLVPTIHGDIESSFYNKNAKIKAKSTFNNQTIEELITLPKQPKHGYNIGGNVLLTKKNINVSLEYNYYTQKKYQSHQGMIKLKVNL